MSSVGVGFVMEESSENNNNNNNNVAPDKDYYIFDDPSNFYFHMPLNLFQTWDEKSTIRTIQ